MINPAVTASIGVVQAAITSIPSRLAGASQVTLAPIALAVAVAVAALDKQAAVTEAAIDQNTVGGIGVLIPAPVLAAALLKQAGLLQDLSTFKIARGYLTRIAVNIANAPG